MSQPIDRRSIKVDVEKIVLESALKIERENACMYHKTEDGLIKPWLLGAVNYCHECGKKLREVE